jgi:hypothetical protein
MKRGGKFSISSGEERAMSGKRLCGWLGFALVVGLLIPAPAQAGPYIGDFGWCWKPAKDCPKGEYSFLHYWTPRLYQLCYELFPAKIAQYPPGLPVDLSWEVDPSPCRTQPPFPSPPYADPAGFFGRPVLAAEAPQAEKK